MKFIISIFLTIGVWSQLCAASVDITKDRRFPIYDLIHTKAHEFASTNIVILTQFYANNWPKFNEEIANNPQLIINRKDFENFTQAMNELFEAGKELETDPNNCDLLKKGDEKLDRANRYGATLVFDNFDDIETRAAKEHYELVEKIYNKTITKISQLNESGDILPWCDKCFESDNDMENFASFKRIVDSYKQGDFKTPTDSCKWNNEILNFFIEAIEMNLKKLTI